MTEEEMEECLNKHDYKESFNKMMEDIMLFGRVVPDTQDEINNKLTKIKEKL